MRKTLFLMMSMVAVTLASCGNSVKGADDAVDTLVNDTVDTIVVDSVVVDTLAV